MSFIWVPNLISLYDKRGDIVRDDTFLCNLVIIILLGPLNIVIRLKPLAIHIYP